VDPAAGVTDQLLRQAGRTSSPTARRAAFDASGSSATRRWTLRRVRSPTPRGRDQERRSVLLDPLRAQLARPARRRFVVNQRLRRPRRRVGDSSRWRRGGPLLATGEEAEDPLISRPVSPSVKRLHYPGEHCR
jgi:hypothetical protein